MTTRIAYLAIILLTFSFSVIAQTAEKTYSKSFSTDSKGTIKLDLPGAIDLKIWDTPTIRISFTVNLSSSDGVLGGLVTAGRYNLVSKSEGDVLTIQAPNMQKQVRIKGEELRETITYVVFVPKDLKIEMPNAENFAIAKK